tara:strand:+ start:1526 stop:1717 length:192 start_codon:yes stop_codon:yes gene_type:complete
MKINKPYFWDLKKPNFLSYLLLPLTIPIIFNNFLLNFKKKKILRILKQFVLEIYMLVVQAKHH